MEHKICSRFTPAKRSLNLSYVRYSRCLSCYNSNPSYYLSVTHHKLAKPAVYNFSNTLLDVPPAESTIQCFIHPTGSLTVNKLKMVILLSGNTTWHRSRPPFHTHTHTRTVRHHTQKPLRKHTRRGDSVQRKAEKRM